MPDPGPGARAGGDIIFRVDGGAAIVQLNRPALTDDPDAELAGFLEALRAADVPALLAIRDTIRQVRCPPPAK